MAGTRRSPQADADGARAVLRAVDRALGRHVDSRTRVAIALSGGRDSVALLAAVVECERVDRANLVAVHVHHGLSKQAQHWADFCRELTVAHDIAFDLRRVDAAVHTGAGIEATARTLRYRALRQAAVDANASVVLLAHHQDDQAETLLLQLLRGAGVHGLAAMPAVRSDDRIAWLRPLLEVPRCDIETYVRLRGLGYVDDDSNASSRHLRNALRHRVVPALARLAEGYPGTIARAAAHQAEAAQLIDELAAIDAAPLLENGSLDRAGLASLQPHRARNVLRHFLRLHGLRAPSTARLGAMLGQLTGSRADASVALSHDGRTLGVYRGRIVVHSAPPGAYARAWRGESSLDLPHGRLDFVATRDSGLAVARFDEAWIVKPRQGGERFQPFAKRPRRALKSWLREAAMPSWQREALPLVFHGEDLVAVPGFGIDIAFQAQVGEAGLALDWRPFP
jgi:tRNA(Ile)-lysidine synthase